MELPIAIPSEKAFTGVAVTVRGFLDKGPGARASLVVEIGNAIKVMEWAFDAPLPEQKDFLVQFFDLDPRPEPQQGLPRPPLTSVPITVLLTAQRRSPEDTILAQVDSIDLLAVP